MGGSDGKEGMRTAIGEDGGVVVGDEGEARGERSSRDGADKAGKSNDGELHLDWRVGLDVVFHRG